jgi:hypothetical protein
VAYFVSDIHLTAKRRILVSRKQDVRAAILRTPVCLAVYFCCTNFVDSDDDASIFSN